MLRIGSIVLVVMFVCSLVSDSSAITRRDDIADSEYLNLAPSVAPFGGRIYSTAGWYGSGVLISPTWVLTAAHCLDGSNPQTFTVGSETVSVESIYTSSYGDIGLAKLATPVTSVDPVKLYDDEYGSEASRVGEVVMISGNGNTGTGTSGQIEGSGWQPRAAYSRFIAMSSAWSGWGDNGLLTRFDAGGYGEGYELSGGSCQGDSGGGMYFNVEGEWALAGVMSQVWWNPGTTVIGQYNTGGDYIRSTPINDWILSYATDAQLIPEPTTLGLLGVGLLGVAAKRRRK